jgi:hypothetical protein
MLTACTFDSDVESGGASASESAGTDQLTTSTGPDPSTSSASASAGSLTTEPGTTSPTTTDPVTTSDPTTSETTTDPTDATTMAADDTTTTSCVPEDEICDGQDNDCDEGVDEGSSRNKMCGDCSFVLSNDGGSYFAICPGPVVWDEARSACAAFGPDVDLAIIDNAADQVALLAAVGDDHWIGVSDIDEEGHWVFVDGTDSIVGGVHQPYDGWASGQPSGGNVENCAELDPGRSGWADSPCTQEQPFICRHPA